MRLSWSAVRTRLRTVSAARVALGLALVGTGNGLAVASLHSVQSEPLRSRVTLVSAQMPSTYLLASSSVRNGAVEYTLSGEGERLPAVSPGGTGGAGTVRLTVSGVAYTVRYTVPSHPVGARLPVIVSAHGIKQSHGAYMRFAEHAQDRQFISLDIDGASGSWNAGRCCGLAWQQEYTSTQAVARILREFFYAHPYDQGRVFMAGFSNGGMLAYKVACEYPTLLRGIAVVSGADMDDCTPRFPVAVMAVHGREDATVPPLGGWSAPLAMQVPSVRQSVAGLARVNEPYGMTTRVVSLPGLGHGWPTFQQGWDATVKIEDFFLKEIGRGARATTGDVLPAP